MRHDRSNHSIVIPLEQGLRHSMRRGLSTLTRNSIVIPLEQGLYDATL